jgi:2-amino-4-hydroxy-6-hydroxymethyldihydropteridine diphosphokinase
VKKQDTLENQAKIAYLALGSNLGSRVKNIEKAKLFLLNKNINIIKCSNYYETYSWPNKNFPKYLNIIIEIKTKLNLQNLFILIKSIEKKLGRKKTLLNYPRTCDIDIIDYNNKCISITIGKHKLKVPHPRMKNRNFVLIPLFEISRNWIHPESNDNISKLISKINFANLRSIKVA